MRHAIAAFLSVFVLGGCGNGPDRRDASSGDATSAADQNKGASSGLVTADAKNRCAGFGAAQAGEILGVPAGTVTAHSQDITPTSRGCEFSAGEKKVSFSLSLEDSIDEARHSLENARETYVISARAQESTTGTKLEQGAYSDILGVGDEAIWSVTNGAMMVRHKNLIIMVLAPDDKRTQAAVATKILDAL